MVLKCTEKLILMIPVGITQRFWFFARQQKHARL